jgi:hypothetical protein
MEVRLCRIRTEVERCKGFAADLDGHLPGLFNELHLGVEGKCEGNCEYDSFHKPLVHHICRGGTTAARTGPKAICSRCLLPDFTSSLL